MVKDLLEESLRMQIFEGNVRAYVDKPQTHFPLNEQGKLDVRRAVGTDGSIQVVKDVGMKDYFSGASPIVSGELGEDFTYYFATSEQTPSSVGLGVLVNPDNSIKVWRIYYSSNARR